MVQWQTYYSMVIWKTWDKGSVLSFFFLSLSFPPNSWLCPEDWKLSKQLTQCFRWSGGYFQESSLFLASQSTLCNVFIQYSNYCPLPILQESHRLIAERIPIGDGSYKHRRDIVFSQAVTTLITCVVFKLLQSLVNKLFVAQLVEVGFLCHWESLLSTMGGEIGMLEDFIVAIHDLNNLKLKVGRILVVGGRQ